MLELSTEDVAGILVHVTLKVKILRLSGFTTRYFIGEMLDEEKRNRPLFHGCKRLRPRIESKVVNS